MTEKELSKFHNKKVKIKTKLGNIYESKADFVSSDENEPMEASIIVKKNNDIYIELYLSDIESIELLN